MFENKHLFQNKANEEGGPHGHTNMSAGPLKVEDLHTLSLFMCTHDAGAITFYLRL